MGFDQILLQQRLVQLRYEAPGPSSSLLSDGRQIDESPTCSRPPSPITTVQNQLEQALLDLHRLTNIPPTIPILNNQVKKTNPTPVRSGVYSQIYEGRWLGEKKVCICTSSTRVGTRSYQMSLGGFENPAGCGRA